MSNIVATQYKLRFIGSKPINANNVISTYSRYLGQRQYELSNHLGNVLTTVADYKTAATNGAAALSSVQNYYPFGMLMPGRNYTHPLPTTSKYRYGFNGKENIDEVYGKGNLPDLGDRMEDVRLGRMNWGIDRKASSYPWQSPYAYYANSPIWQIDFNGEGDYYDRKGVKRGSDGNKDDKNYIVYKLKDLNKLDKNKENNKTTDLKSLKDAILLPSVDVREKMQGMIDRMNSANTNRTDNYRGDDDEGGFHEEGGYFTEDKLVNALPGKKQDPSKSSDPATINPFASAEYVSGVSASSENTRKQTPALGTVHVHPSGSKDGNSFKQDVSISKDKGKDDLTGLSGAKSSNLVQKNGYGIVIYTISTLKGNVTHSITIYDENGIKVNLDFKTFLNIGK